MAIERIRAAETERDRLQSVCVDRGRALSDVMEALRQNERKAEAKYQRSEASEQAWKERYKETNEKLRLLREEFENLQSWPAWRMTKRVLECFLMRRFVRPAIRAIRPLLVFRW